MKFRGGSLTVCAMAATAPWATYALVSGIAVSLYLSLFIILATITRSFSGERIYFGRPVVALLVYCCLIGVSVSWSLTPSVWAAGYNLWCWTTYLLAMFAVINFLRDAKALRWFVYASAIGALITLPLLAPYEGDDILTTSRYAVHGHNANFTAYTLAGAFFVSVLCMRYLRVSTTIKILLLGVIGVILIEMSLLDTRGAQLSIFLSGMTIAWGKWVTKSVARGASICAILLSIAFSLGWLTPLLVWVDSLSARSTGDLSGRVLIWLDATRFILERPFFGIGPGSFLELGTFELGVHNVFLLVLLDCGVVGLGVFLWFLYEVWRAIMTLGKEGQRIFFALLMYWLPMAISGHWETAPYSWAVVGFAICLARVLAETGAPRMAPKAVGPNLVTIKRPGGVLQGSGV